MRRQSGVAVVVALIALTGCDRQPEPASKAVSDSQLRAELSEAHRLRAGQYRNSFSIERFDVPGMSAQEAQTIRQAMTSEAAVQTRSCLTEEDAQRGPERMFEQLAQRGGECRFDRFSVDGDAVSGALRCAPQGGTSVAMTMTGTIRPDGSTMRMVQTITDPNLPQGRATVAFRVDAQRTGACTAQGGQGR